jgi:hypothetical protein
MNQAVISLFDLTGNAVRPWAEAGYECWAFDIQHPVRGPRTERVGAGQIHYVYADARAVKRPTSKPISFMIVQSPCTHTAVCGAQDFPRKGGYLLRDALELFESGRQVAEWSGAPYCQEQPVTMLASIPHIGKPHYYFHPWQYAALCEADNYTKKTAIWGGNGFLMPEPCPAPHLGPPDKKKIHFASPGDDRGDIRSEAPLGFYRAVFHANAMRLAEGAE